MDFYKNTVVTSAPINSIRFWFVYVISIVFTFQSLLTAYSSSTYIEQFTVPEMVGILYAIAATASTALFFGLPPLLRRFGNVAVILTLMALSCIALLLVGFAPTPLITLAAFVFFLALNPLIYLNIDIFSETLIGDDEGATGSKRGLALSLMSIAALLAPLTMGYIIGEGDNLAPVYFAAVGVGVVFMVMIIGAFRQFYDPPYVSVKIRPLLKQVRSNVDIRTVLAAHFLLQFFFCWMVIYFPLYLATEIGLNWTQIGSIISASLVAYVFFEFPIGLLTDTSYGEKRIMALGFVILAISSATIATITSTGIVAWIVLMFISRIGASFVEVTSESYFFKLIKGSNASLMSLFRLTRPLANLAGALIGSVALLYLPFNLVFIILGTIMVAGIYLTTFLRNNINGAANTVPDDSRSSVPH